MGTGRTVVGGLVFVSFIGALALRPLLSNPGVIGALETGPGPALLLWGPLLFVTLAIIGFRLKSTRSETTEYQPQTRVESNHWEVEDDETGTGDRRGDEHSDSQETGDRPDHVSDQQDALERMLGGQGGARDRGFDIEQEPPESGLDEHLEHLREELDGGDAATELRTLEEVIEEYEDDQPIPKECPGEYCDALWEARTVTDLTTGRYELLDGGEKIVCLECEETFRVESE